MTGFKKHFIDPLVGGRLLQVVSVISPDRELNHQPSYQPHHNVTPRQTQQTREEEN